MKQTQTHPLTHHHYKKMAQRIPLALDKNGVKVLPAAELRDQEKFTCIECAMDLVLVGSDSSQTWHFAHASGEDHDCPAWESLKTLAAQLIIVKYITRIKLATWCGRKEHKLEKQYEGCAASLDTRYAGHYPGDVAVIEDGELKAIVEVKCPRGWAHGEFSTRKSRVGSENVWEVDANAIIDAQSRLHSTEGSFELDATNHECQQCTVDWLASAQFKRLNRAIARGDWDPPSPTRAEKKRRREARLYPYGKPSDGLCRSCCKKLP